MYRLVEDRLCNAVSVDAIVSEETVLAGTSTWVIRERRQYGVIVQFQGNERRWWVVCRVFRSDLLTENMVVQWRCSQVDTVTTLVCLRGGIQDLLTVDELLGSAKEE